MSWYLWQGEQLIINLKVQPKASRDEIVGPYGKEGDTLKVRICAPPVDGKAKAHLLKFLAKQFGIPKSDVKLLSGASGRTKKVSINRPQQFPEKAEIIPLK